MKYLLIFCLFNLYLLFVYCNDTFKCTKDSCKKHCVANKSCLQGCNYYGLIYMTGTIKDKAEKCLESCSDSYIKEKERNACKAGCIYFQTEVQVCSKQVEEKNTIDAPSNIFHPFLVVRRMYSAIIDHVQSTLIFTYSFYKRDNSDDVLVIREGPLVFQKPREIQHNSPPQPLTLREKIGNWFHNVFHRDVSHHSHHSWACVRVLRPFLVFAICLSILSLIWITCLVPATAPKQRLLKSKSADKKITASDVFDESDIKKSPLFFEDAGPLPKKSSII